LANLPYTPLGLTIDANATTTKHHIVVLE